MPLANSHAAESMYDGFARNPKDATVDWIFLVIILVVFSFACGKRKTQVKPPLPRPTVTVAAKKTELPKKKIPQAPSAPIQENPPQPAVAEKSLPAIMPPPPATEYAIGPLIRIGLTTTAKELRISSMGNYLFMEKIPEAAQQLIQGEMQISLEQGEDEVSSIYRVQVASFANTDAAEDLKTKIVGMFSFPVTIRANPEIGTNQVRVGEFEGKEEAQSLLKDLIDSGYRDAFVVKDTVSSGNGKSALALRGPDNLFRLSHSGFLIQPSSSASFLCVDTKCYRGLLDVFQNKNGRITVVNQLGTEEYLLGVVPAEMSPAQYPEFEALAAQSIAARTYALKNMGRFRAEGFDLSNDTRTQVYSGVAVEAIASDEAVRKTAGLAIYYEDKLIDALYMSTCGGKTEDYQNIFDGPDVPYLKSVFCAVESGAEKGATVLEGKHDLDQSVLADDGSVANRNIELARMLGVIGTDQAVSIEFLSGPAGKNEIQRWIGNARKAARKNRSEDSRTIANIETRSGFLEYAAESFWGASEIRRKLSTRDLDYYLGNLKDGNVVPESARYALAFLMQGGLWRPNPDNAVRPDEPILRKDALFLIVNWIESVRSGVMNKGAFVPSKTGDEALRSNAAIKIKNGKNNQEFRLSEKPYLFRWDSRRSLPVGSAKIIGNEKLSFYVGSAGTIEFLEIELNPNGASSDRYSPAANWDVTIARSTVAEKLRGLTGNIGQIGDIIPARIGSSGRMVQVQVSGSRGSVVINGYKARNALGLKDIPFELTREYHSDGSIASFTFHGHGWGHGVGLCQIGSFGMAQAGHSYEEIIKTYYSGVEIRKAY